MLAAIPYLQTATPYLALGALVLALITLGYALFLRNKFKHLTLGGQPLEDALKTLLKEREENREFRSELEKYLKLVESRLRHAVMGVGTVRFNPFSEGQGGNQSFAAAFLDEQGQGVVLSTLYTRERVGVYAKPLNQGNSTFDLTPEEKEAIAKAKESIARARKK